MKKLFGLIVAAVLLFGLLPTHNISADIDTERDYIIKITVMGTDGSRPIEYHYDDVKPLEDKIRRFSKEEMIDLGNRYLHDAKLLIEDLKAYNVLKFTSTDKSLVNCPGFTDEYWFDVLSETAGTEIGFTIVFNGNGVAVERPVKANVVCQAYYTISADSKGGSIEVAERATAGEQIEVIPTAEEGKILDTLVYRVEGSEEVAIEKTDEGYFFEMPAGDVTVAARFRIVPEVSAPVGKSLEYNGEEQELVDAGTTTGGTLVYSLDGETYAVDIPKKADPGTYTVYYKVEKDEDYFGTDPETVEAVIENVYPVYSGDQGEWQEGSSSSMEIVFKADFDDEHTYDRFMNGGKILVDDVEISSENYEVSSGSLKISLKPSYLETLSVGEHRLQVLFSDGASAVATFHVKEKPAPKPLDKSSDSGYKMPLTGVE